MVRWKRKLGTTKLKVPFYFMDKMSNVDVTVIRRLHVARVPNLDLLPYFFLVHFGCCFSCCLCRQCKH